jgi:hypothetical protein
MIIIKDKKGIYVPTIELRNEPVQELMDKKPSYILRYGIGLILFSLCCLFVGSKYIPYPDELEVNVVLPSNVISKEFTNNSKAEILSIIPFLESKVTEGDTLAVLFQNNDTVVYMSPFDGNVYVSGKYSVGNIVDTRDLVILVFNNKVKTLSYAYSLLDSAHVAKIDCGMVLETEEKDGKYKVKYISRIPDGKGLYSVYYECISENEKSRIIQEMRVGRIQIDKSNVFDRFFKTGIERMVKI